jgi:tryptophan synthase beta subunit
MRICTKQEGQNFWLQPTTEVLEAALLLTQLEGIIPALESAHALAALEKLELKPDNVNVVNLSGSGNKDMETYLKLFWLLRFEYRVVRY